MTWIIILCIAVLLAVILAIRACYEFVTLTRTDYELETEKLAEGKDLTLTVLTDLHNRSYGENNQKLLDMVRETKPDVILLVGDILTASVKKDPEPVFALLKELSQITKVYYAPGNHEKKIQEEAERYGELDRRFQEVLNETQIRYLENDWEDLDEKVRIYGLDMDLSYYPKFVKTITAPRYTAGEMLKAVGELDPEHYNIVLAHSPKYFKAYAQSGADLILSGHYHGGAVRIPKVGGVISPQFVLFPKYDKGKYETDTSCMIVSSGCGSHKVHLRLWNKPEVMVVKIHGHFI